MPQIICFLTLTLVRMWYEESTPPPPPGVSNPNSPKCNVAKKVPNLNIYDKLLRIFFPKESLLPMKTLIIVSLNPTKFMHDEGVPLLGSPSLNEIPKFMFDWFAYILEAKDTLLGDGCWCNVSPSFIDLDYLMPDRPHEGAFPYCILQVGVATTMLLQVSITLVKNGCETS